MADALEGLKRAVWHPHAGMVAAGGRGEGTALQSWASPRKSLKSMRSASRGGTRMVTVMRLGRWPWAWM